MNSSGKKAFLIVGYLLISEFAGCSARKNVVVATTLTSSEIVALEKSDQPIVAILSADSKSAVSKYSPNFHTRESLVLNVVGVPIRQTEVSKIDLTFDVVQEISIFVTTEGPQNQGVWPDTGDSDLKFICRFDSHLSIDDNVASALAMYGTPVNGSFGLRKRSQISQVSPVIHAGKGVSGSSLTKICADKFLTDFRKGNVTIMARFAENMNFNMPKERCRLAKAPRPESGDDSCLTWFHRQHADLAQLAVPRCLEIEELSGEEGFCAVRSKYMAPCPVFLNQDLAYAENPDDGSVELASDPINRQFFCDSERQQLCRARKNGGDRLFVVSGVCDTP
jgi:hypothetical protein